MAFRRHSTAFHQVLYKDGGPVQAGRGSTLAALNEAHPKLCELRADAAADWAGSALAGLVQATPSNAMLLNDIYDREPLDSLVDGPVALVGDAAHPTTPHCGKGANMAVQDAFALARCLLRQPSLDAALREFDRLRAPEARRLVLSSRHYGRLRSGVFGDALRRGAAHGSEAEPDASERAVRVPPASWDELSSDEWRAAIAACGQPCPWQGDGLVPREGFSEA